MTEFGQSPELLLNLEALVRPIPSMESLREVKKKDGYAHIPIDREAKEYREPIVALKELGIDGVSYYSEPNGLGDPIPGVDPEQYLRVSVAEKLKIINDRLRRQDITSFFGRPVGLYVRDGLRPVWLQQKIYEEIIPDRIRKQHPGISDEAMYEIRKTIVAAPSTNPDSPSPHATGAVFDIELRYLDEDGRITDEMVEMGHEENNATEQIFPDYFEIHPPTTETAELAQRNRRAFYNIMTGAAFGIETGFVNNPHEWWHWGIGDQLSAMVSGQPFAVYSIV